MSIVSGLATAPGIAPLLNAPRETQQDHRASPSSARADGIEANGSAKEANGIPRPVIAVESRPNASGVGGFAPSQDNRYVRFVEAVQALRLDPTLTPVDKRKVADLLNKATEYFLVNDGVPREVQPLPPDAQAKIEPMEEIMPNPEELREAAFEDTSDDAAASDEEQVAAEDSDSAEVLGQTFGKDLDASEPAEQFGNPDVGSKPISEEQPELNLDNGLAEQKVEETTEVLSETVAEKRNDTETSG